MIYVHLATGDGFGWGICGDNLTNELARLVPIERIGRDPIPPRHLTGALLQKIGGANLRPKHPGLTCDRHVGYVFFEEDLVAKRAAEYARDTYDVVATGSTWCEAALREAGLSSVATVHQGVDHTRFHPRPLEEPDTRDKFVLFSGGKFELRKSQDLVVQAFKVLAERHPDVLLVAAWHNPWPAFAATMAGSRYVPYIPSSDRPLYESVRRWLLAAGIDLDRVRLIPALRNERMASVYWDTDIGIFPNRCEGGTNLVMMEYMACGRPVVATEFSGHRDVLNHANSIRLQKLEPLPIVRNGTPTACWCEPDLDELIESIEMAYQCRDRLPVLGQRAAVDLAEWTWERAARNFIKLLTQQDLDPR